MKTLTSATAPRGAATKAQVANLMAGVDAIEVKATIPDHSIDAALDRYGFTVCNDKERYIWI